MRSFVYILMSLRNSLYVPLLLSPFLIFSKNATSSAETESLGGGPSGSGNCGTSVASDCSISGCACRCLERLVLGRGGMPIGMGSIVCDDLFFFGGADVGGGAN